MKGIWFLLLSLITLTFLLFPHDVLADFSFSLNQTTISPTDELEIPVTLSLQGQAQKNYYLEGAFKKEGSSSYFGLTHNDTDWTPYSSSDYTSLKKITTNSDGVWTGILKTKLDLSNSQYIGAGNYTLQIRRFTESGSITNSDNTLTVQVQIPSIPSPSPSPSPSPQQSSNPTIQQSPSPSPTSPNPTPSFFVSQPPVEIGATEEFTVTVTLSKQTPNSNYFLKGAFVQEESTNYFGKTKVGDSWIKNNSSSSTQFPITTDSNGSWSGELTVQGDPTDSGYTGTGAYIFKVARYNSSGSGLTWSNQYEVTISGNIGGTEPSTSPTPAPPLSTKPASNPSSNPFNPKTPLQISTPSASTPAQLLGAATRSADITPIIATNTLTKRAVNFWLIGPAILLFITSLISVVIKLKKRYNSSQWFTKATQQLKLKLWLSKLLRILKKAEQSP